jgi:hypothetical protein
MLNIFADAMLIATRLGRPYDDAIHTRRRTPREFQDIEGLTIADRLRNQAR